MNYGQNVRINRVYNEKIYLLDVSKNPFDYMIKICGTTKNVYNVKISYNGYNKGKLVCNCPDGRKFINSKTFCKHCCFVLIKLLKYEKSDLESLFALLIFTDKQLEHLQTIFSKFNIDSHNDIINHDLVNKFINYKDPDFKIKEVNKEEDCPICYDKFGTDDLKSCPSCNNAFHTKCINMWLINSVNKSCPYCRSTVWEKLNNDFNSYKNLA